jgi:neutral amino acid transport system permease protein
MPATTPTRVRSVGVLLLVLVAAAVFAGPASAQTDGPVDPTAPPAVNDPGGGVPPGDTIPTTIPAEAAPDEGVDEPDEVDDGGPSIVATLTVGSPPRPVEGVTMIVSADGAEVGRADSDEDGRIRVQVPAGGTYEVTLDPDTFPEGVDFAEGARTELRPIVQSIGERPVIFRLAEEGGVARGRPSDAQRLLTLLASGVRFGLVIGLSAVGLSLIFGTTGLTNFAHGELVSFGAISTWYLNSDTFGPGLPLVFAAVGGILLTGAFAASFELGVFGPLRRRGMPVLSQMVVSIGLAIALRYVFSIVYGASSRQYAQYAAQSPTVRIGDISLRPKDVVITIVALIGVIAVGLFLQKARLGTAIRAVSDNGDLSTASGIDTRRVILLVWILAGVLAGAGGLMLGTTDLVSWNMGQQVLLIMFASVLLGGLGTAYGAMVGGLFVGIVSDLSTFWLDADLKIVVALGTLVLVLLVRPQGVFGVRTRTA